MNFFLPAGTDWSPSFKMLNNSLSPIFHLSSEGLIPIPNQNHSFPLQLMSVELYDPYETNLYCYPLNIKWLAKLVIIAPLVEHSFVMNINFFKHTNNNLAKWGWGARLFFDKYDFHTLSRSIIKQINTKKHGLDAHGAGVFNR